MFLSTKKIVTEAITKQKSCNQTRTISQFYEVKVYLWIHLNHDVQTTSIGNKGIWFLPNNPGKTLLWVVSVHLCPSTSHCTGHLLFFRTWDDLNRELKQPGRRQQQTPHKFAYLTMKNSIFARFARAFLIFWHFEDVLVLSMMWNDLFCRCVDDLSIWWQMFNFVFLCPKHWFQFNSKRVRRHFSSIMTLNNWKIIAETQSYIFRWRSRFRRCHVCLSSLLFHYVLTMKGWL